MGDRKVRRPRITAKVIRGLIKMEAITTGAFLGVKPETTEEKAMHSDLESAARYVWDLRFWLDDKKARRNRGE